MPLFKYLYSAYVALVFIFWMLIVLPFVVIPYILGKKIGGDIAFFFLKTWAYLFSWMTFIRFSVKGRDKVNSEEASIIICNHTSFLDAPGFAIAMKGQCRPLGKVEMTKFPIFGWIYRMNVVLVDRSSRDSRNKSFEELRKTISKNISILIFPEGTMNRGDTNLQPFYNGAFRLAKELDIKIQPLIIENAINLMPRGGGLKVSPGLVEMNYLDPISPEGFDEESLKNYCYKVMLDFLTAKNKINP